MWDVSAANWDRFEFTIEGARNGVIEVAFRGVERIGGTEVGGVLWFRVEHQGGRIARLWSALDAARLP